MSLLSSAVDAMNYAAGFTHEFNGTGLFDGVKLKRPPEDQRAAIEKGYSTRAKGSSF